MSCKHYYTEGTAHGAVSCIDCKRVLWTPQEQPCDTCAQFVPHSNGLMGRCRRLKRTFLTHHHHMLKTGEPPCWEEQHAGPRTGETGES